MENLQLKDHRIERFNHLAPEDRQNVHLNGDVSCFCVTDKLHIVEFDRRPEEVEIPQELAEDILYTKYLRIQKVVFAATNTNLIGFDIKNTKFFSLKRENPDDKIAAVSWNPAETFLVIINERGRLIGYSFNIDAEEPFNREANASLYDNVPSSVYVGWGAHNTQFKGISRVDDETVPEVPQEYSNPVISWRGNGELFVVNYWHHDRRFLKVYDVTLKALFASEPYNNLLAPTAFKDKGNFIACAAHDGEQNQIVVYEKNCLVRSKFYVPENEGEIQELSYHPEKHMLAIHSRTATESHLNIYAYSNDTWYLKQQLLFSLNDGRRLITFQWINDFSRRTCRLNIVTTETMETFIYSLQVYGVYHDLIAVTNGKRVCFTGFSQELVPPPMATKVIELERPVNEISFYSSEDVYGFTLSNGEVVYYKYGNRDFVKYIDTEGLLKGIEPANNTMMSFTKVLNGARHVVILTDINDLLIDGELVMKNVLSVHVHRDYLLFTHAAFDSYTLYSVRFTQETISNWNGQRFYLRQIEHGAKIICVTNNDQVVLLLPRGNLETITCRLISIDLIERLLCQNDWRAAITQIRIKRMNWNLLIDLNKKRFINHINDFMAAISTVSLLNTILTEFREENCLHAMYKSWASEESELEQASNEKEVSDYSKSDILKEILRILVEKNPITNLSSIVAVQMKHFSLKAALYSILNVFEMGETQVCHNTVRQILRSKAPLELIHTTHTLYHLDFLRFIYSCCSEDPRCYEQEIAALSELSPVELRFAMNERGKDFKTATRYLVRMDNKDEAFVTKFINAHETQSVAYNSVEPGYRHFRTVSKLYADHLSMKGRHNEAGLVFERAKMFEEALDRYRKATNRHKVVIMLNVLKVEGDARKEVLTGLARELIQDKQVAEGCLVYLHHLDDHLAAIKAYVDSRMFDKALCLARERNLIDVIDELIQPAIKQYREALSEKIEEMTTTFVRHTARLLKVRKDKLEKFLHKRNMALNLSDMDSRLEGIEYANSEFGSIISRSSVMSGSSKSSSRSVRKMEKKKKDLREGGRYEDIALMWHLYQLAQDIFALADDVNGISATLIDEENFAAGKILQKNLLGAQQLVRETIPRIWSETFLHGEMSSEPAILAVIENRQELDEPFRTPPELDEKRDNWRVRIFN